MASLFDKLKNLITQSKADHDFPTTVEEAVDRILFDISEHKKSMISNMSQDRLSVFHQSFGFYIMNTMRLWTNEPLKGSCCELEGVSKVSTDQASYIILKELQKRIKQSDYKEFNM